MRIPRKIVHLLLLASLLPTASLSTEAGIFLPLQNINPQSVEVLKFLSDPMIKRFKVVRIDVEALVATFDQDGDPITFHLFEDITPTVRVLIAEHRETFDRATYLDRETSDEVLPEKKIWGQLTFDKDTSQVRGFLRSREWYVGIWPTSEPTYYVVYEGYLDLIPQYD